MRQIKFRAFYPSLKEMSFTFNPIYERFSWKEDDEAVFMQFTGLTDKNGKEIYEGDMLRYVKKWTITKGRNKGTEKTEEHFWEVFFTPRGQWRIRRGEQEAALYDTAPKHDVIGNIYENPDLLTPPHSPQV